MTPVFTIVVCIVLKCQESRWEDNPRTFPQIAKNAVFLNQQTETRLSTDWIIWKSRIIALCKAIFALRVSKHFWIIGRILPSRAVVVQSRVKQDFNRVLDLKKNCSEIFMMVRNLKAEAGDHFAKLIARDRIQKIFLPPAYSGGLIFKKKPPFRFGRILQILTGDTDSHNLFYRQFRAIYFIQTVFGRIAIQKSSKGDYVWKWFSWLSIYCLLNYALQTYLAVQVCKPRLSAIYTSSEYDEVLFAMNVLGYIQIHFQVPFTFWIQGPKYAEYLNQWTHFQEDWLNVTGKKLKLRYKTATWLSMVIWLVLILMILPLEEHALLHEPYLHLLPFFILLTSIACFVETLYITCLEIGAIAKTLLRILLKKLNTQVDRRALRNWRVLWIDLGSLVTNIGTHHFAILTAIFISFSATFLFGIYNAHVRIAKGEFNAATMGYLSASLISLSIVYILCDSGHRATTQVEHFKKQLILRSELYFHQEDLRYEIDLILRVLECNNPRIELAGFVTLNRPLFISFLANIITYVIVILQFKENAQETA